MISGAEVDHIKEVISNLIDDSDGFEESEGDLFIKNNYNEIIYLPTFHEILRSNPPYHKLHIFSFIKIGQIIQNYSNEWTFTNFEEISQWLNDYIDESSDFIFENPRILFNTFTQTYLTLVKAASSKYPFFHNFFNALKTRFTSNIYRSKPSTSFIVLFLFKELCLQQESEFDDQKKNFYSKQNRQFIFTFSMQNLGIIYDNYLRDESVTLSSLNGIIRDLINLIFTIILSLRDFIRNPDFVFFFKYSNFLPGNTEILNLCEIALAQGEGEDVDSEVPYVIEENFLTIVNSEDQESRFKKALKNEVNLLYFTRFVESVRKRNGDFSMFFVENLVPFTADLLKSNFLTTSTEVCFNLVSFFANYKNDDDLKPPELMQTAFLTAIYESVSKDPDQFATMFDLYGPGLNRLVSIVTILFRYNFTDFFNEIERQLGNNLKLRTQSERGSEVKTSLSLFVRIIEHVVRCMLASGETEFADKYLQLIFTVQRESLLPLMLPGAQKDVPAAVQFSESEILSILLFDKFFAQADELLFYDCIGCDEYNDCVGLVLRVAYAAMRVFSPNKELFQLAAQILTIICEEKSDEVYFDTNWIISEVKTADFDIASTFMFDSCSQLYEALFFHEMRQISPRFDLFIRLYSERRAGTSDGAILRHAMLLDLAFFAGIIEGLKKFNQKGQIELEKVAIEQPKTIETAAPATAPVAEREEPESVHSEPDFEFEEEEEDVDDEGHRDKEEEEEPVTQKSDTEEEVNDEEDFDDYIEMPSYAQLLFDFLFDGYLKDFCEFAERQKVESEDEILNLQKILITHGFLVFSIRFANLLKMLQPAPHSASANLAFKLIASTTQNIIVNFTFVIKEINKRQAALNEMPIEVDYDAFNQLRSKYISILKLCVYLAAELLSVESVSFGAFFVYNDGIYTEFIDEVIKTVRFIGIDSFFLNADDSNFEQGFDPKHSLFTLVKACYKTHAAIFLNDINERKSDIFEEFYKSTFSFIERFDENENDKEKDYSNVITLLSILLDQLIEIFYFNYNACFACIIVQNDLQRIMMAIFDDVFIKKNKKNRELGDEVLVNMFADYLILDDYFAESVFTLAMSACKRLEVNALKVIWSEIDDAVNNHNLIRTKDSFANFYSFWFKP